MSLREIIPTSFADVLNLFGISLQGQKDNSFVLTGEVTPVVLVGSTTEIQSISSPMTMNIPATLGDVAAPAAGALLADTGALEAGVYSVFVHVGCQNTANSGDFIIQRRNAANAANLWQIRSGLKVADSETSFQFTCRLEVNERIRVVEANIGSYTVLANIWTERLGA